MIHHLCLNTASLDQRAHTEYSSDSTGVRRDETLCIVQHRVQKERERVKSEGARALFEGCASDTFKRAVSDQNTAAYE